MHEEDTFTVSLEKLDTVLINTIAPKCFACKDSFTVEDKVCVRVAVARQPPLRFHDGYCMQHFTYGCYLFLENREKMKMQPVLQ